MKLTKICMLFFLISMFACSEEENYIKKINNLLLKQDYKIFNAVNADLFNILIFTNDNNVLLVAANNNKIFDYKIIVNKNRELGRPSFLIKNDVFAIIINFELYIFNDSSFLFETISDVYPASVYIIDNFIFTESASPNIAGLKFDLETLELVEKYNGSGTSDIETKYKYSNGKGFLKEANKERKQIIIETYKNKFPAMK